MLRIIVALCYIYSLFSINTAISINKNGCYTSSLKWKIGFNTELSSYAGTTVSEASSKRPKAEDVVLVNRILLCF